MATAFFIFGGIVLAVCVILVTLDKLLQWRDRRHVLTYRPPDPESNGNGLSFERERIAP